MVGHGYKQKIEEVKRSISSRKIKLEEPLPNKKKEKEGGPPLAPFARSPPPPPLGSLGSLGGGLAWG